MRYRDRVIWVTGASSGIGEGLARAFHAEGAHVVISARRVDELARVKASCTGPGTTLVVPFDVTDEAARAAAVKQVLERFGRVDMLVNNAGLSQRSLTKDTMLAVDRRIMEVDYFAVIALTKLVLPTMLALGRGHLVATSSVAGKFGTWNRSAYAAAKHALHGFFDTLRIETAAAGIDVSLLVIADVVTPVAVHALTGDGTPCGKLDRAPGQGISVEDCARIVLDGLAAKAHEIVVAPPFGRRMLWLARYWPRRFFKLMTRMAPR